jgi:hypothetical protein
VQTATFTRSDDVQYGTTDDPEKDAGRTGQ